MRLLLMTCAAIASLASASLDNDWERFKTTYNKMYSAEEEQQRRSVWEKNLEEFRAHNELYNQGKTSYFIGENKFADMTPKELRKRFTGLLSLYPREPGVYESGKYKGVLPDHVDWRTKGYVSSIKDQGDCGSCYAFGTTEALEGQHFKATGKLVELSPSNIVDCSGAYGNTGCGGGYPEWAYNYMIAMNGVDTLASYPYVPFDGVCRFSNKTKGSTISAYKNVTKGDEDALQKAVATEGPISVGICAAEKFFNYKGGIFDDPKCSTTYLDHEVLVVGYGSEGGKDYWIVKNSYGTAWGEKGYIRMSRNKKNQCGIATDANWPVVQATEN